jgi:hypothetical protein
MANDVVVVVRGVTEEEMIVGIIETTGRGL